MPARSEKQRRYLEATKRHAWVKEHHFDRVESKKKKKKRVKKK